MTWKGAMSAMRAATRSLMRFSLQQGVQARLGILTIKLPHLRIDGGIFGMQQVGCLEEHLAQHGEKFGGIGGGIGIDRGVLAAVHAPAQVGIKRC